MARRLAHWEHDKHNLKEGGLACRWAWHRPRGMPDRAAARYLTQDSRDSRSEFHVAVENRSFASSSTRSLGVARHLTTTNFSRSSNFRVEARWMTTSGTPGRCSVSSSGPTVICFQAPRAETAHNERPPSTNETPSTAIIEYPRHWLKAAQAAIGMMSAGAERIPVERALSARKVVGMAFGRSNE